MKKVEPFVVNESELETEQMEDPTRGLIRWRTLLSSERTPSEGMTCGVAEIQPGPTIEGLMPHRHLQAEVYYVISGQGLVTIDGIDHKVRGGSTVFIPSNAVHGIVNTGPEILKFFYTFATDSFEDVDYHF